MVGGVYFRFVVDDGEVLDTKKDNTKVNTVLISALGVLYGHCVNVAMNGTHLLEMVLLVFGAVV